MLAKLRATVGLLCGGKNPHFFIIETLNQHHPKCTGEVVLMNSKYLNHLTGSLNIQRPIV
jgi:hypothetical protein